MVAPIDSRTPERKLLDRALTALISALAADEAELYGAAEHDVAGLRKEWIADAVGVIAQAEELGLIDQEGDDEQSKIIAYYRVSTKRQGQSGLGLESQREAVERYAASIGAAIVAEYTEVESGKKSKRPELASAIAHAKRAKATLVVAKLDRLARNMAFTSALMESGVEFVACDNTHANRLTIHILAAIAEHEAQQISERTKAALAAAKRKGAKLGASNPNCRNLTAESRARGSQAGAQAVKRAADEAYQDMREFFQAMRPAFSYQQIADVLNQRGDRTRTGKPWSDVAVMRACKRLLIG